VSRYRKEFAHQSEKDEKELDDIGVGDRVESTEERVKNGDASRQDDTDVDVNVYDDADGRSCRISTAKKFKQK
jgi:hypothetical protein